MNFETMKEGQSYRAPHVVAGTIWGDRDRQSAGASERSRRYLLPFHEGVMGHFYRHHAAIVGRARDRPTPKPA